MKFSRFVFLSSMVSLMSCSNYQYVAKSDQNSGSAAAYRGIAKTSFDESSPIGKKVSDLTSRIFQSYLLGHVELEKFDQELDKNPEKAMDSEHYDRLQAIRVMVDGFEHDINDLYLDLVKVSALPGHSFDQKIEAQSALDAIGRFMEGVRTNGQELPENLRPLILSNLVKKQTELYGELKTIREDESMTKNDEKAKSVFWDNMVLLRATRRSYNHDLASYQVDSELVKAALKEESQKKSFQQFEKDIKKLSGEMKQIRKDIKSGRSTSSDVFFPSTGSAGNVTGNGYPARTWSITYDDGPGGKTTPQVLANLKNHGFKATFFQLAQQVKGLPSTSKSVLAEGHDVACHSYSHKQLTKLGPQGLSHEIDEAKKVQEAALGIKVKLFRLPYGAGVSRADIRSRIAALNMIHVFWNVDTLDWQDKNPQKILNRAIKQMSAAKNHAGIILFHDIHPQSVIASNMLMDYLKKNDFKVCTVQSVIDQVNKALPGCE